MADNQNATRTEIEMDQRGLSRDEIQELSIREMQDVTGGDVPIEEVSFRYSKIELVYNAIPPVLEWSDATGVSE